MPRCRGRAHLRVSARLLDFSISGLSVSCPERLPVPHVYRVICREPPLDLEAQAVWCYLVGREHDTPRYDAGLEVHGALTDLGQQLVSYLQRLLPGELRRFGRYRVESEVELQLATEARCEVLAMAEGEPVNLRIETILLPSLQSRLRLSLETATQVFDLEGRVGHIRSLSRSRELPRTQLEVAIAGHSFADLESLLEGG